MGPFDATIPRIKFRLRIDVKRKLRVLNIKPIHQIRSQRMTVMNESGPTPGVTAIGIERNRQAGHIRIRIIYGEIEAKVIKIPIGPTD